MATFQGRPHLAGPLLGPLSAPGNRFLDATLLGLTVKERGLSCWLQVPEPPGSTPHLTQEARRNEAP